MGLYGVCNNPKGHGQLAVESPFAGPFQERNGNGLERPKGYITKSDSRPCDHKHLNHDVGCRSVIRRRRTSRLNSGRRRRKLNAIFRGANEQIRVIESRDIM